ncbi:SURP and G-patch domain-containing protein 1-like protein [Ricinus communis]|uniref:Arginine/serine rich splicing factor sf4/14, putative n=1 Tax=Ricinus communis TaxID=3988 RepID=B9RHH0_RICCO|nr:SURP and G-patch domain-containing protein 1-like protein [Ricinus communis]XP_015571021.1 SURP and G-patch domain-containing protein 1-like protein [Ricinus communis]XP_015571022.1 SURP and G-patch domain-containing protein 1-like protein [Ricinus communis]EEF49180.1 arginine/serine rich splicing factor sf4/14, putative [Ricinus communis]|eukprot:XP_002513189.1 SURP and G-patch domain-containing protein 1-like protein [Ricinus communis]
MDKKAPSTLFVNDGSFMERFKQLQQEKGMDPEKDKLAVEKESKPKTIISGTLAPKPSTGKISLQFKANNANKTPQPPSGGKLAFSLKQKSKIVTPVVKLGEDEDDADVGNVSGDASAKRQKLSQSDSSELSSKQVDVAPLSPSDPTVKKVADKLASFVAKNGRQFEHITRQKNPGDTPFKFLFDKTCSDYKYYEFRLAEEERALSQTGDSENSPSGATSPSASKFSSGSQRSHQQQPNYQIPASALYDATDEPGGSLTSAQIASVGRAGDSSGTDPIAMMEFYMKKAAQEERRRQPKQSKDEMPPPPSLQGPGASSKRGHHMGDYIPQEELEKFLATCNDAAAQRAAKESAERSKIQADNVGHKLLSKMGWKEGEGLGSARSGIADPIKAGNVKTNNLGVGAHQPGEVTPEDDIYEQYKKRMMLGYRYRPNPLNNPRKAYY